MYKHLTSRKKTQEEKTAHTQKRTPERNDQKGAAQHPENTNKLRGQERVKKGGWRGEEEKKNDTTVSWVKFGHGACRGCAGLSRKGGGVSKDRAPLVRTFSVSGGGGTVQFCVVLDWTEIPEFGCAGLCGPVWFLCGCCCWFTVDLGVVS